MELRFDVAKLIDDQPVEAVVTIDALGLPGQPIRQSDLPPKVVPPRVLVQAPPFGWGVVQEAEVG